MMEFIFDGGPLMWPIVLLSVVGLAVMIDRFLVLRAAAKIPAKDLEERVYAAIAKNDTEGAIGVCAEAKGPVAAVLLVGLKKLARLEADGADLATAVAAITKAMEDYAPNAVAIFEKNLWILPVVAGMSPLLGMTGTVTGMIGSFNAMANATTLEATTVSGGISEALITTAAGLLVAMPSVIAYNIFSKRADAAALEIERATTGLVDFIGERT